MSASFRILSTSTVDSTPAVLFTAPDASKILVNCGEGCQRIFLEQSQKLSTVRAVCLTHLSHESIGGLPGVILTSADSAAAAIADKFRESNQLDHKHLVAETKHDDPDPKLTIVGPYGTQNFIHSLRHFMRRDKFKIVVQEGPIEDFQFKSALKKSKDKLKEENNFFTITSIDCQGDIVTANTMSEKKRKLPESENGLSTRIQQHFASFIIKTPRILGKFLVQKALSLGIPKGALFGKLKSGESVTFLNSDGVQQTVESSEVVEPTSPSVAVMILYYPTDDIALQLFAAAAMQAKYWDDIILESVIHITSKKLFHSYGQNHCKDCVNYTSAKHIFISTDRFNHECEDTPFQASADGARARSCLCDDVYPSPMTSICSVSEHPPVDTFIIGRRSMEYHLTPLSKRGLYYDRPQNESKDDDLISFVRSSGAMQLSQALKDKLIKQSNQEKEEAELIFTGTGSAVPCKHRNVTGIFLRQADGRSLLLDVGEGTIGQLLRSKWQVGPDVILSSIKVVWISHPHADHHLGLIRLLRDRTATDKVLVIAPSPIFRFLEEYSTIDPMISNRYEAIECNSLVHHYDQHKYIIQNKVGVGGIRAIPVQHCQHSYACILECTDFGRLVYSGDCRPSKSLMLEAREADLLIHEATFQDGMEAEAILKRHSTVGEALDVAIQMEAKCVVLTHFSQRYPNIQPLGVEKQVNFPIIFAFDYMRLKPSTLVIASKLTPAIRLLYPETEESIGKLTKNSFEEVMAVPGLFAQSGIL